MCEGNGTVVMFDSEIGGETGETLMFPAAAVLVFLLYLLLFHELISQFCCNGKNKEGYTAKGGSTLGYRYGDKYNVLKIYTSVPILWKSKRVFIIITLWLAGMAFLKLAFN